MQICMAPNLVRRWIPKSLEEHDPRRPNIEKVAREPFQGAAYNHPIPTMQTPT